MILVMGATGFLGKRVCKKLDSKGIEYNKTSLSLGTDLREKDSTYKLFDKIKPQKVINCASYVGGIQFGNKHSAEIYNNGLIIQANLYAACQKFGVKRIVNPISNCSYPSEATLFKEDEFWNGPLHDSVLVYGMVRKMSYIGAVAYNKQYSLDTVNLILPNMYGPEDYFEEERSHALGALVMKIVEAKEKGYSSVSVWGSGRPVREWLHVDDGAEALVRALDIKPYIDPINIGIAKGISIKDMAEMIKDIVGYNGKLEYDLTKIDGAPYKTMDGSLCKKIFKWEPEIEFEKGLKDTIQWYMMNRSKNA